MNLIWPFSNNCYFLFFLTLVYILLRVKNYNKSISTVSNEIGTRFSVDIEISYHLHHHHIIYIKNDPKIKISLIEVWSKLLCLVFVNYLLFFMIYACIIQIATKENDAI